MELRAWGFRATERPPEGLPSPNIVIVIDRPAVVLILGEEVVLLKKNVGTLIPSSGARAPGRSILPPTPKCGRERLRSARVVLGL
jgi:hypothetical protein